HQSRLKGLSALECGIGLTPTWLAIVPTSSPQRKIFEVFSALGLV
ncbi:hypothetical protein A2U01_0029088, partial [Trifolium medium]|nr:hypothetical protein [Trifolium medium]